MTESVRSFHVSGHARHHGLAAQLAVRSHFAGHAGHFGSENAELLNHGVDDVCRAKKFAFERPAVHVQPDSLGEIALGDGGDGAGHFVGGPQQVLHQGVDRDFHVVPCAPAPLHADALAGLAFFSHRLAYTLQLERHLLVRCDNLIEVVGNLTG